MDIELTELRESQPRRVEQLQHREITERFGPFTFTIQLRWDGTRLHYQIVKGKLLGIRLPHALRPRTVAFETVEDERFRFDVSVSLPLIGLLAHYRGWLEPDPERDP